MNLLSSLTKVDYRGYLALLLAVSLLLWSFGITTLQADDTPRPLDLQNVLSDSAPGMPAIHNISFRLGAGVDALDAGNIVISFEDAGGESFDLDELGTGDITIGGAGDGELSVTSVVGNEITLAVTGELIADDVVTLTIGGGTADDSIINPNHVFAGDPMEAVTHEIIVTFTDVDTSNTTRVAIIDSISMTAAVDTIFEFSVGGVASSTDVHTGVATTTTTGASTPTSFDFGTLEPGTFYFLAHELTVETNASNGFVVTVQESQELTSSTGEVIHRFNAAVAESVGQATPIAWVAPTPSLGNAETYGHYGITSNDASLADATEVLTDADFVAEAGGGFVGNFQVDPRPVFGYSGPSDGLTPGAGVAQVGVGIQITSLQAAGDDYANTLTYVATPTF